MKRFMIEVPEPTDEIFGSGFDVVDERGQRTNGLNFDELLGQVIALMHPQLDGKPQYRMQSAQAWEADRYVACLRRAEQQAGETNSANAAGLATGA